MKTKTNDEESCGKMGMHKILSRAAFFFGLMSMAAAVYSWGVFDLWLASTQWVLLSNFLILVAIYIHISEKDDLELEKELEKEKKEHAKKIASKEKNEKKEETEEEAKHVSFKLSR